MTGLNQSTVLSTEYALPMKWTQVHEVVDTSCIHCRHLIDGSLTMQNRQGHFGNFLALLVEEDPMLTPT